MPDTYSVVHRCVLQLLMARSAISKSELEGDLLTKLNSQYNTSYSLERLVDQINKRLRDIEIGIKKITCDDGETYFCIINTSNDVIASSCSLSEKHLKAAEFIIRKVAEHDNVKYVDVVSDLKDAPGFSKDAIILVNDLFTNHWFYRYRCQNTETIIGGPRLILEMSHWLTETLHLSECPICLDPVVGGLHCPHGCGAVLHRSCAYRSLYSLQSTDDDSNKGICPNCKKQWVVALSNFSDNGTIYKT